MAAALPHSATAQLTGISPLGTGSEAAQRGCWGVAEATALGQRVGRAATNLNFVPIPGAGQRRGSR